MLLENQGIITVESTHRILHNEMNNKLLLALLLCVSAIMCSVGKQQAVGPVKIYYTIPAESTINEYDEVTNSTRVVAPFVAEKIALSKSVIYYSSGHSIFSISPPDYSTPLLFVRTNASGVYPITGLSISGTNAYWAINRTIFTKPLDEVANTDPKVVFKYNGGANPITSLSVNEDHNILFFTNHSQLLFVVDLQTSHLSSFNYSIPFLHTFGNVTGVGTRDSMFAFGCGASIYLGQVNLIEEVNPICVGNCLTISRREQFIPVGTHVYYLLSSLPFITKDDIEHEVVRARSPIGGFDIAQNK